MPCVQGCSPAMEQPVALQDWAQLGALGEKLSSQPASRNAVLPLGNYLHSQMRMTQIARAVTTAGKISSGGRSEPQVHPFVRTVFVSESLGSLWRQVCSGLLQEQQPCLVWLWVSKISRQISSSWARPWLGLAGESIGNCLALKGCLSGLLGDEYVLSSTISIWGCTCLAYTWIHKESLRTEIHLPAP